MKGKRGQCVVLVPFPYQGHITPMLQLGSILHSQGFSIIVAHTEYNAPNPTNHPEFVFLPMNDGEKGYDVPLVSVANIIDMNENCKVPLRGYLNKMIDEEGVQIACIIYDNIMTFVDSVATELKIPTIVMRHTNATYFLSIHTILQQPEKYFPIQDSQREDPLPELYPLKIKDVPFYLIDNTVPKHILQFYRGMMDIRSSVATIMNTLEDLEPSQLSQLQQHFKVPFFPMGPFHKMAPSTSSTSILIEDNSCIEWLDKQASNSVLYVSLGSLATIDEKGLMEIAWGLSKSEQPFLWVIRPGTIYGSKWIESMPEDFMKLIGERGKIVKWAPQKQVLAHRALAGFMSHCGWNSMLESICEGVPLVCMPFLDDNGLNTRYLREIYKVGVEVEVIERSVIANTVKKLVSSDEGKALKKRVCEMKEKIVAATQPGGSSYKKMNELVEFITSLASRAPPTLPAAAV